MEKEKQTKANRIIYTLFAVIIGVIMLITVFTSIGKRNNGAAGDETSAAVTSVTSRVPDRIDGRGTSRITTSLSEETEPAAETVTDNEAKDVLGNLIASLKFSMHTYGYVTKKFTTDAFVFSLTMNDYRTHNGIDIAAALGAPVRAAANGTIKTIYSDPMMGNCVTIDHGDGLFSHYMNLSDDTPAGIAEGVPVKAGTQIGSVGETSLVELADAPHLHFEMTRSGTRLDPMAYIENKETTDYSE